MPISIEVKLPAPEVIERKAKKALRASLNGMLNRSSVEIQKRLRILIFQAITLSEEYQALISGPLHHEIGVPDVATRLSSIINTWANSITVKVRLVRFTSTGIIGGFRITGLDASWSDVLTSPDASFVTEKGKNLPWLEWLLIQGKGVIVRDYEVILSTTRRSRTGKGIMVRGKRRRWKIPSQHAGTTKNNFVTRALERASKRIGDIVMTEVLKQVR